MLGHPWSSSARLSPIFLCRQKTTTRHQQLRRAKRSWPFEVTRSFHDPPASPSVCPPFSRVHLVPFAIIVYQSSIVNSTAWQPRHGGLKIPPVIHVRLRRLLPGATTNAIHHRPRPPKPPLRPRTQPVHILLRFSRVDDLMRDGPLPLTLFCRRLPSRRPRAA